jgi:membrane associated rhomboid family serine protease
MLKTRNRSTLRMAYSTRSYARPYVSSGGIPPGIKWLLISNTVIFLLWYFTPQANIWEYFHLSARDVLTRGFIWQLVTYLFMHGGIGHILFNMLALWMFGSEIEQTWGTRRFLRFYFFCGVGAALCVLAANFITSDPRPTIGASGAIYGILLVSAVLWPDRIILFSFLFPIKMKYFVMIIGAIAFLQSTSINSGVSNIAHLGGMAFGYIFLKFKSKNRGVDPIAGLQNAYQSWKLARAKRKFQVYLRKQKSDRGDWVN